MYGVVASYGLGQRLSDFPTDAINLLNDHAALFLAIPMIWITFVSFFNFRQPVARGGKNWLLLSGVFVVAALAIFVGYADFVAPHLIDGDGDK
jgi:hypothetical protein